MILKLVVLLLVAAGLGSSLDVQSYRQLPNYGVTMKHLGKVDVKAQKWQHEFMLRVPTLEQVFRNATYCPARTNSCDASTANQFLTSVNDLVKTRYDKFRGFLSTMFPAGTPAPRSDSEQFLSLKFEPMALTQIKDASEVVNVGAIEDFYIPPLIKMKYEPLGYISDKDVDKLFQYADLVNQGLVMNDGHMRALARNITVAMRNLAYDSFDAASYVASVATAASEALQTLDTLQASARYLASGRLPAEMVTPADLKTGFMYIRDDTQFSASRFHIVSTDPTYYYSIDTVKTVLAGDKLSIFVDIPVSLNPKERWDLYRTEAWPLATSQDPSTDAATLLSGFQPYLLVRPDRSAYLELSQAELDACPGESLRMCETFFSEVSTKVSSCHLGLFLDDVQMVNDKCILNMLSSEMRPAMKELEPGLYLMNKLANLLLDCPKTKHDANLFTNCQQCLRRIPCQCSVRSDYVVSTPRMVQGCSDDFDPRTNYTLNVIMMLQTGRRIGGLTGASPVDEATKRKLGVTFEEKDFAELTNRPTQLTLKVQNLPSIEAQVEEVPSGMGAGGIVALVALLIAVCLFAISIYKWRQLETDMRNISARQAGVDLPVVLNGNGFRHHAANAGEEDEEEEAQNHLMEVREMK